MARSLVEKRPQAIQDLSDIALYLADQSGRDDLAFHFLDAAESSFEDLAAMPTMGTARDYVDSALADVRLWRVAGFDNYLIFYRRTESGIEVTPIRAPSDGFTNPISDAYRGPCSAIVTMSGCPST